MSSILTIIVFLGGYNTQAIASNNSGILKELCLISFHTKMKTIRQSPQEEVANFTCECFLKKIENNIELNSAKSQCKQEVKEKFKL